MMILHVIVLTSYSTQIMNEEWPMNTKKLLMKSNNRKLLKNRERLLKKMNGKSLLMDKERSLMKHKKQSSYCKQ